MFREKQLALIFYFWSDIIKYLKAFFKSFIRFNVREDFDQRMAWFLFFGSLPAALVGFFLEFQIETYFRKLEVVAATLIVVGLLFFIFEKYSAKTDELNNLNFKKVIFIGVAQTLALIPGISRSGITIIAGLSKKLKREVAARFSFLLSVPIIFGAGLKKISDVLQEGLGSSEYLILILGFLAALFSGYLSIRYFLQYIKNHSLNAFAIYRFLLAIVIIVYLLI